jgi:hypothetical protein
MAKKTRQKERIIEERRGRLNPKAVLLKLGFKKEGMFIPTVIINQLTGQRK